MADFEKAFKGLQDAQEAGVVLGLAGIGPPQPRLDIDELMLLENGKTFNLFILALKELMDPAVSSEKMSYFQIAGRPKKVES